VSVDPSPSGVRGQRKQTEVGSFKCHHVAMDVQAAVPQKYLQAF